MQSGPEQGSNDGIPRDALGRPCLDVEAAARKRFGGSDMMDHVVSIKNNCPKLIKIKLCYYKSESCLPVELQAYKRVDSILGSSRGSNFFRYSYTVVQR